MKKQKIRKKLLADFVEQNLRNIMNRDTLKLLRFYKLVDDLS